MDPSAWLPHQIQSKLWLCEKVEPILALDSKPKEILLLAGWQGVLPFLLASRDRFPLQRIVSIDLDSQANFVANTLNSYFLKNHQFLAIDGDINSFLQFPLREIDLVINTSCEHFSSDEWWNSIREGTLVALQGTDMPAEDHLRAISSEKVLLEYFPLRECIFSGGIPLQVNHGTYSRFMIVGRK